MANGKGIGFLLPQGGGAGGSFGPTSPGSMGGPQGIQKGNEPSGTGLLPSTPRPSRIHHEGDFGIGQGLVPGIFGASQKSVQKTLLEHVTHMKRQANKQRILRSQRCKR